MGKFLFAPWDSGVPKDSLFCSCALKPPDKRNGDVFALEFSGVFMVYYRDKAMLDSGGHLSIQKNHGGNDEDENGFKN